MSNKKELIFGVPAREELLKGMEVVCDAVASTLGPRATNVAMDREWGAPLIHHDGVGVAREINLPEPFQNMGAQLIKEAASKTNDVAGDGTTTATILAYAIAQEAHRNVVAGSNPMMLRKGIEKAVDVVIEELDAAAIPIKTNDELRQVATISAQNEEIGLLVSDAIERMGKEGVITVEESGMTEMSTEYKEGMQFDKGFLLRNFITDEASEEATVENAYILITDKQIGAMQDFMPFMEKFLKTPDKKSNNIVFIVGGMTGEPLAILAVNKIQGKIQTIAIQAPTIADKRTALLEDIAVITGGKFISEQSHTMLEKVELADLGFAHRVTCTKDTTLIVKGDGSKEKIADRLKMLRSSKANATSDYQREQFEERIAKLTTGIAIINVGAHSETEMRELKERVIDAISATKSASEQGIVPGGETALIRAAQKLSTLKEEGDIAIGINIVRKAIEKPFKRLMVNASLDEGRMIAALETLMDKPTWGIDVMDGEAKDLVKAGIIDPVKVTKSALRNAASVAIMIVTTNVLITPIKETKSDADAI